MISSQELLKSSSFDTDVLFIGLPTHLSKKHLANVTYRRVVLFDYHDSWGPIWTESDREFLLSLTDRYFKPWLETSWDFGLKIGLLPIRRRFLLPCYLRYQNLLSRLRSPHTSERSVDVVFTGNGTGALDNQRVQWLLEINQAPKPYSFCGGMISSHKSREHLEKQFGDLTHIWYAKRRVSFATYFNQLRRAKVALAPAGNARWSYRHYEAIYAGAVTVTTDFRNAEMLVPLPVHNMIHVADDQPVLPAIDQALELRDRRPEITEENVCFLERYLYYGDYSRKRPVLMDKFMSQIK